MISGMSNRICPSITPTAPFRNSRGLLDDLPSLRQRLAEDGYLYLRDFMDPVPLLRARADILDLCRQAGWLKPGSALMEGLSDGVYRHEGQESYKPVYRQIVRLASFNACAESPLLLQLFRGLFQQPVLAHPRNICRLAFPGGDQPTQPHQDFQYIRGSKETYTCWIPTSGVPAKLGGLAVQPGTHKLGFLPHSRTVGAGGFGVQVDAPWVGGNYALGDILIMHSHTVHAARDHRDSQRIRISFDFRYQPAGEAIDPSSLCYHMEDQPRKHAGHH
jgi:hypothetical protein